MSGVAIPVAARISCETGDPGERLYAMICGDQKMVRVFLDDVEQKDVVMADPELGFIKRAVRTPEGNVAFNRKTGEIFYETVRGEVRWETCAYPPPEQAAFLARFKARAAS